MATGKSEITYVTFYWTALLRGPSCWSGPRAAATQKGPVSINCWKGSWLVTFSSKSRWQPTQSPIQWACMPLIPYHSGRSAKASCMACRRGERTGRSREQMVRGLLRKTPGDTEGGLAVSPLLAHLPITGPQQRRETCTHDDSIS